jgi:hypothetical protein
VHRLSWAKRAKGKDRKRIVRRRSLVFVIAVKPLVFQWVVLLQVFLGNLPIDPYLAHGEDFRIQMDIIEMPDNEDKKAHGSLEGMDESVQVEHPLREDHHKKGFKPEDEA